MCWESVNACLPFANLAMLLAKSQHDNMLSVSTATSTQLNLCYVAEASPCMNCCRPTAQCGGAHVGFWHRLALQLSL